MVPGRSGIEENEIADYAAKTRRSMTGYGPEPFIPVSQSCRKVAISRWSIKRMNQNWQRKIGYNETKVAETN